MGPKAQPAQPRAMPHGIEDGPWRTPKHVADPLVAIWDSVLDFPLTPKSFYPMILTHPSWGIHHKVIRY